MKLTHHGDLLYFECEACGCRFREAVSKTSLANCGVWNSERKEHGTWMECPDCGNDVLGFRLKENEDGK